ncbi:MAG: preprotein translocase subunit SecE [Candidatus Electrothrix sp. AR4]|nr:preprotein translocase subunit SecE [Candidatus Electrothrix sp. AR4]
MANKKRKSGGAAKRVEGEASKSSLAPANIRQFYHEVVAEFKKIVWPDRKVTLGLSGFVILLTVVLSLYLGTVDFVLGKLVSMVLQ